MGKSHSLVKPLPLDGLSGKPDPDFKPDEGYVMVWDEVKKVYRRVKADEAEKLLAS